MNSISPDAPPLIVNMQLLAFVVMLLLFFFYLRKTSGGVIFVYFISAIQLLGFIWYSVWFRQSLASGKLGKYFFSWSNQFFITKITQYLHSIIVGWFVAAILLLVLWFIFLKRGSGRLLDEVDVLAITLGAVVVGWPAVLIFLALIFILSVVGMLFLIIIRKKSINDRLVVTPFIIPAAILTLFFGPYFLALTHLDKIRF